MPYNRDQTSAWCRPTARDQIITDFHSAYMSKPVSDEIGTPVKYSNYCREVTFSYEDVQGNLLHRAYVLGK